MPLGSELTIVSGEPVAGGSHLSGCLALSITLHAAVVAVVAGAGWWVDNRVRVPVGHASNPSARAIQLTASVSQITSVASLQLMPQVSGEKLDAEADLAEIADEPVEANVWDQTDRPLTKLVAAELPRAVRRDLSQPQALSQKEPPPSQAAPVKSQTVESELADDADASNQDPPTLDRDPDEAEPDTATSQDSAESEAAIASRNRGAKVDVVAKPLPTNQPPRFPADALQDGRGGRVVLKVTVDEEGSVTRLAVIKASGHADLDRAAMEGVASWKFLPARRLGLPVTQDIAVPISFEFE